ncbi:hypothetical protein CRG98_036886 [Punica granatum]|uniref:Methyltransferase type 11 domain-containing protein n=1 Tax=Punica granatum TaxID=22663 RepID=A0A2I0IFJ7_PUNGR|nr:hypothetical protein CRG98_036886 [Punica granatum]
MALYANTCKLYVDSFAKGRQVGCRGRTIGEGIVAVKAAASSEVAEFEAGLLERPKWAGETPLSRIVGAVISFKPIYSLLKLGARQVLISTAEKKDIPWREMTREILESDVYKELETVQNSSLVYPDYYLSPFHAYDEGNLSWVGLDLSPYFLSVAQFKEKKRPPRANPIRWRHANGEETGLPSSSFDLISISLVPNSKVLQELSPVLFTLLKSTEPFLDEYYLINLEETVRETGFVNVTSALSDARHRTLTATVPF